MQSGNSADTSPQSETNSPNVTLGLCLLNIWVDAEWGEGLRVMHWVGGFWVGSMFYWVTWDKILGERVEISVCHTVLSAKQSLLIGSVGNFKISIFSSIHFGFLWSPCIYSTEYSLKFKKKEEKCATFRDTFKMELLLFKSECY